MDRQWFHTVSAACTACLTSYSRVRRTRQSVRGRWHSHWLIDDCQPNVSVCRLFLRQLFHVAGDERWQYGAAVRHCSVVATFQRPHHVTSSLQLALWHGRVRHYCELHWKQYEKEIVC